MLVELCCLFEGQKNVKIAIVNIMYINMSCALYAIQLL